MRLGNASTVAGDIQRNATQVITLAQGSQVDNQVYPNAHGNGGNIKIDTGSLTVQSGSQLSTPLFGQGNGGNIIINAPDRITFDGKNNDNYGVEKAEVRRQKAEGRRTPA
ncbi:hypothetical protein G7B40_009365 [Aetokthonos hydrillicola Thurmond2011]|jgi:large exoprotein involved in heme utilization and adhesion|uniref:Filamentous hemagglutinin n=1 Tax=Aetokthonos hydrillicola Thurmond2011 TaxID=2712845 RepID=A0AAP5I4S4_9CYAN|nr:hypothetical protein [Aetokthonos hydrillicola]MBO3457543.1 hypothetical protein [Aetokthonos hydrillicola CCALA 1050]MBW4590753.1 hypothetical protein [Aetokthonos hydrillicola CCALA 1050]MDR9894776.1 hypothetical protein [Aetokthonos hydrillicola Thurmond2011]